jgi:Cof subfamily protein (haloacid dehalogenase superfamily)
MSEKQLIRLAGLDLDGTLLNERYELTPAVIQAFSCAVQAKLQVVVITGRDRLSAMPFLKQLGAEQTAITSGGAQIWLNGDLVSQASFTSQQIRDILAVGLQHEAGMFVDQPQQTWRYGARYYTNLYGHVSDSIDIENGEALLDPLPFKVSLIQEPPVLSLIRTRLTEMHPGFTITSPFSQVLDVNPEGGNKGAALTRLASLLDIALSQTAVAGDSENDLSMFAIAGLTYAMGNATEALRACADHVAPANDEEGVVWALSNIMERNREK